MKLLPRIIPSLLLKNGGLVKGKNFKDHVYVGDPINAFRIYNDKEVDEICLLNISNEEKIILAVEKKAYHEWVITIMDELNSYGFTNLQLQTYQK